LRGTAYCTDSHRSYARKHGVSAAQLDQIDRGDYSGLDARGVGAMALVEAMLGLRKGIPNAMFAELKRNFAVNEIVELIALVGIMELACSLADVFELEPD
jgi:alkylhydroperoxidase family enzyme